MAKKMTMADIARLSGVGKSTVSRYFNGGYVKEETRAKIQKVIEQYHYTPNAFARLNARQSNVIGVIVPTLNSKITSRVITSIDRYLREKDYTTLIQNSDHDIDQELKNIQRLIQLNVDGILISSIAITKDHKELLKKAEIPIVVLTQDYEDGISIIYDDYHAGKMMGEYIGKNGHKKVGYISVYETDRAVGIERKRGVLDGLKEYGIDAVVGKSDYSFIGGQKVARELLEEHSDLDAIICATDRLAFGTYKILHEKGKKIPEDVSVAAFGGYDESSLLTPELTTLKFDSYGMGYLGAETILKMIKKEVVSKKQIIGYEFVDGKSVRFLR
ncbi:LacI family DNA-binding transcriptional regulator [Anaerostipes sp.]|uniref:LacI family DNA-binding transcriptional regulator n=1 Tax=Anaerostipes sp. TaxID=1872530 RepID=UPI003FED7927